MSVWYDRRGYTALCRSIEDARLSPQPRHTTSPSECAIDEELFLRAQSEDDSEDDYTDADPVLDDLYFRRVQQTLHQTSNNPNYDRFLPRYWTPEEDTRVRTIYLGSRRRPWYRKMQGLSRKALGSSVEVFDFICRLSTSATVQNISATSGERQTISKKLSPEPEHSLLS